MTFGGDSFVVKMAASYVTARDATRAQLTQQIVDKTAHLEDILRLIEWL